MTWQKVNESARGALRQLAVRAMSMKEPAFVLVNNRIEGNAPGTIEAVMSRLR